MKSTDAMKSPGAIGAAIDPWEKAADCERAAQATSDPRRRSILIKLENLWATLANESAMMTPAELASEAERIGRVQADLTLGDLWIPARTPRLNAQSRRIAPASGGHRFAG
jgi:hypothetical protein